MGSTSNLLRFVGGGEVRYIFDSRGRVIELAAVGVRASMSPQRVVSFGAHEGGPVWR